MDRTALFQTRFVFLFAAGFFLSARLTASDSLGAGFQSARRVVEVHEESMIAAMFGSLTPDDGISRLRSKAARDGIPITMFPGTRALRADLPPFSKVFFASVPHNDTVFVGTILKGNGVLYYLSPELTFRARATFKTDEEMKKLQNFTWPVQSLPKKERSVIPALIEKWAAEAELLDKNGFPIKRS